jgi:ATP-binding cassette subfamily B protein
VKYTISWSGTPSHESILENGVDLGGIKSDEWQQILGVFNQDVLFMSGGIRVDIALVLPGACLDQIRAVSWAVDAEFSILSLPDYYETTICEGGFRLSGGQRQHLSLARSLLKLPQLLVLDEATSALDSPIDARILATLYKWHS